MGRSSLLQTVLLKSNVISSRLVQGDIIWRVTIGNHSSLSVEELCLHSAKHMPRRMGSFWRPLPVPVPLGPAQSPNLKWIMLRSHPMAYQELPFPLLPLPPMFLTMGEEAFDFQNYTWDIHQHRQTELTKHKSPLLKPSPAPTLPQAHLNNTPSDSAVPERIISVSVSPLLQNNITTTG